MSMIIAHNLSAINTQRNLFTSNRGLSKSMEKLSSGYRINVGADGPADLVISEQLRAQQSGLERAVRNTTEATNVIAIGEGALNEMNNILKKMKQLAIHAANEGVTSPQQIAADQSEMDSAIQTLEKIANTTRYSDQQLLNGNKQLTYARSTIVRGTQQNSLVNTGMSEFDQVFRRNDYNVAIGFTGSKDALLSTGTGTVDFTKQATRAYMEVDTGENTISQVDAEGNLTQDQNFILTGKKGAKNYKYNKGTSITTIVQQIHASVDSTGIDAALVFNSDQLIDKTVGVSDAKAPHAYTATELLDADGDAIELIVGGTLPYSADARTNGVVNVELNQDLTFTVDIDGVIVSADWNGKDTLAIEDGDYAGLTISASKPIDVSATFNGANTAIIGLATPAATSAQFKAYDDGSGGVVNLALNASGLSDAALSALAEMGAASIGVEFNPLVSGSTSFRLVAYDADGKELKSQSVAIATLANNTTGTLAGGLFEGLVYTFSGTTAPADADAPAANAAAVPALAYDLSGARVTTATTIVEANHEATDPDAFTAANLALLTAGGVGAARGAGTIQVFGNTYAAKVAAGGQSVTGGVSSVEVLEDLVQYGKNTDGQGRIWVKFTSDNSFELYKDASLSTESLVAYGLDGEEVKAVNNSGLEGLRLTMTGHDLVSKKGVYISTGGIEGANAGIILGGNLNGDGGAEEQADGTLNGNGTFEAASTYVSGVELGTNTDQLGKIYTRTIVKDGTIQVMAYRDKACLDKDLVAQSAVYDVADADAATIVLSEVRNADNSAGTGLGITLSFAGGAFQNVKNGIQDGEIAFTQLGMRVFSQEYGSDAGFIKVQQITGGLFTYYQSQEDPSSKKLIDAGANGLTFELRGQNATLSVNGQQVFTRGLELKLATQDLQARLQFNEGRVGSTTLAQVGYGTGSLFSRIGALNLGLATIQTLDGLSGLLCNAGHNTSEMIGDFSNGMQLQLGEGAGDQERTVVSIQSMAIANMGRLTKGGFWDNGRAVYSERQFCMQDVLGGSAASLMTNPILAMQIIDRAINDVSDLRARLGAVQSNLLTTNENNLRVAIENIAKTESNIRDTDMAGEMTDFTKNQILQNAGMSMLAQANAAQQNVLQLLG